MILVHRLLHLVQLVKWHLIKLVLLHVVKLIMHIGIIYLVKKLLIIFHLAHWLLHIVSIFLEISYCQIDKLFKKIWKFVLYFVVASKSFESR